MTNQINDSDYLNRGFVPLITTTSAKADEFEAAYGKECERMPNGMMELIVVRAEDSAEAEGLAFRLFVAPHEEASAD